jgi:sec-independent protein translocase protein TatA
VGSIGAGELILILVIALIVFGPKRLPEVGRTIGKSLREFRRASQDIRDEFRFSLDEEPPPPPTVATPPPQPVEPITEVVRAKTAKTTAKTKTTTRKPRTPKPERSA